MKGTLLVMSMLMLCFFGNAQRSVDLELSITSPADGANIEIEELYNFVVSVKNADAAEDFLAEDSVYYYLLMWGDTMTFAPSNTNYLSYTGNLLHPSESFGISRMSAFSDQFEGMDVELCVAVQPVNQANAVNDPDQSNNTDCITVHVTGHNNLSVPENPQTAFRLIPNPATTGFALTNVPENAVITISDLSGQTLDFVLNPDGTIHCSEWKNGVYLVRMEHSDGNFIRRLVISH